MTERKDNQEGTVTKKELIGTLVVLFVSAMFVCTLLDVVYLVGTDGIAADAEKFIYDATGSYTDFNGDGKVGDFYPGFNAEDESR
jgi:hypothetical protein